MNCSEWVVAGIQKTWSNVRSIARDVSSGRGSEKNNSTEAEGSSSPKSTWELQTTPVNARRISEKHDAQIV